MRIILQKLSKMLFFEAEKKTPATNEKKLTYFSSYNIIMLAAHTLKYINSCVYVYSQQPHGARYNALPYY